MPTTVPVLSETPGIWLEDIRHFLMDRSAADNDLLLDVQFTDEEINRAIERCVMHYNEVPPQCDPVHVSNVPRTYMFITGVAYHLSLSLMLKLMRNDVDYNAGGVQVEIDKRRIEHLKEIVPALKGDFMDLAQSRKRSINIEGAYGAH